jgi:hypothetical protein
MAIFFLAHIIACGWYYVGTIAQDAEYGGNPDEWSPEEVGW